MQLMLIRVILVSLMLLPEWHSPFGRIGIETVLFPLVIVPMMRSVSTERMRSLLPIALPALAALISYAYSLFVLDGPIETWGLRTLGSWTKSIMVALLGLYLGSLIKPEVLPEVVKAFSWCCILALVFAFCQMISETVRGLTFSLYWPVVEDDHLNWEEILASRPSSTMGRVFSWAFFAATLFLTFLRPRGAVGSVPATGASPNTDYPRANWLSAGNPLIVVQSNEVRATSRQIHPSVYLTIAILALLATLATQTKGALLSVLLGLLFMIMNSLSIRNAIIWFVNVFLLLGIVFFAVDNEYLPRFGAISHLIGGRWSDALEVLAVDPSIAARYDYVQLQWEIFLDEPVLGDMHRGHEGFFSDNLYIDVLAKMGIVGLAAVLSIPVYFYTIHRRYLGLLKRGGNVFSDHLLLSRLIAWSGFVALVMGLTWNLFTSHRSMLVIYFLCGLLEGQWSVLRASGLTMQPKMSPECRNPIRLAQDK